jgi:hypothetical protein
MDEKNAAAGTHSHAEGCFFCNTAMPMLEKLVGETTRDHFRNSRVEFLKGMRSLLDEKIAYLSREESKGTHVTVE